MERLLGTRAYGIRTPIIGRGDDLSTIVADSVAKAVKVEGFSLHENDVIGITEAVVAKSQGNFASLDDLAADVKNKFPGGTVGLVFPILSRNRFVNILKGIARGADKVYVLLQFPQDEVGNPVMDMNSIDDLEDQLQNTPISGADFKKITADYIHPFTGVNYIDLYESVGDNIEVFLSNDPRDILKLTSHVLVGEIHARNRTKTRLEKAGAQNVYTLSDLLSEPVNGSGYNPMYGVLGSNLDTKESLKLFPKDCEEFVEEVRQKIADRTGVAPEVLVYGDGAFKDPVCGIWELADPVVSPAYTDRLGGQPREIKLKYVSENLFGGLSAGDKHKAITDLIKDKHLNGVEHAEGTTPRKFSDLLGSLCDLMSGSGDKGTPVILIQGYFDDLSHD